MHSKKRRKVIYGALTPAALVFLIIAVALFVYRPLYSIDETNLPQFVASPIIQPEHLGSISKFRSGFGENVTSGDETCSNMQQHLLPPSNAGFFDANALPAKTIDAAKNIPVFIPVDGKILSINPASNGQGSVIRFRANDQKAYIFSLIQVYPLDDLKIGDTLNAGDRIGSKTPQQSVIISVEAQTIFSGRVLVPFTSLLTESAFTENFANRAEGGRSVYVITRKTRAQEKLTCDGNKFVYPNYGNVSSGLNERTKKDIVQLAGIVK